MTDNDPVHLLYRAEAKAMEFLHRIRVLREVAATSPEGIPFTGMMARESLREAEFWLSEFLKRGSSE